jgi:hypothetical protein
MTTEPLDPAAIMAEHNYLHRCIGGGFWNNRVSGDQCLPYRLAADLAAERQESAMWKRAYDRNLSIRANLKADLAEREKVTNA